jgi:hypothetical protein
MATAPLTLYLTLFRFAFYLTFSLSLIVCGDDMVQIHVVKVYLEVADHT